MRYGFGAIALLLFSGLMFAQTQRGTIAGTITDSTGAVIPNATVQVLNAETGAKFDAVSNGTGYYAIPFLPYGSYSLTANVAGFKSYVAQAIEVAAATTTTLNVTLQVGNASDEVSVTASTVLLESNTSAVSAGVEQKLKDDLPVANRRDPTAFIMTVPGYSALGQPSLAGGRRGTDNVLLDGQAPDISISSPGGNATLPSVESIGEFKVMLNSVPAEYGRTGGPTISFATRSGTNEYHGAGYEYYQTSDLNARAWQAAARGNTSQHYFGGVAGGPVRIPKLYDGRNKSFFFVDYSDIRNVSNGGSSAVATVATAAMRNGDFSDKTINPIYDVNSPITSPTGAITYAQFPGNIIPQSRESKVSKNLLALIPQPTAAGGVNNFVGVLSPGQATQWLLATKGDQYLSDKDRVSGTFSASRPQSTTASVLGANFSDMTVTRFERARLDWSRSFTPHVSQQLLFGVTRNWTNVASANYGQNLGAKAGLSGAFDGNCPRIVMNRTLSDTLTLCNNLYSTTAATNWTTNYSLLINHGSHSFKLGVDYIRYNTNIAGGSNSLQDAAGAYNFGGIPPRPTISPLSSGLSTFMNYATSQTNATGGNDWADFYLGLPGIAYMAAPAIFGFRESYFATYFQDDWRVSKKLTINAGLRWDLNVPYSEVHGQVARFDANTPNPGAGGRLGAIVFYGDGPGRLNTNRAGTYYLKAFGPRLGFAYNLNNKTVIRGFAGLLYAGTQSSNVTNSSHFGFQAAGEPVSSNRFTQYYNWDNPFPQSVLGKTPNLDSTIQNGQGAEAQQPNGVALPPYSVMMSFSIQHEVRFGILLEAAWLANNMKHGTDRLQLNTLPEQYWKLGPLLDLPLNNPQVIAAGYGASPYPGYNMSLPLYQALRPYPQYLDIAEDATNGTSSTYNALILKAQKRFSSGLSFLANYTWSKYITDSQWSTGSTGSFPTINNNRKLDKGLYRFEVPQRAVLSYSYDLPFGKGKKFLNHSRLMDLAVGGWTITGLQQYTQGYPAAFTGSFNTAIPTITGLANRAADVLTRSAISCKDMVYNNPKLNYMFNAGNPAQAAATGRPLAFIPSGNYAIGNMPRFDPNARQCPVFDEDLSVFKSFAIREHIRFRVGGEAINLLNRHTWVSGGNGQVITSPNFGAIVPSQVYGPRVVTVKFRMEF